jgi:hypothetical protein
MFKWLGPAVHRLDLGFASMPDRAKANSAFLRCRTRVVPLRTVNESLNGEMREAHADSGREIEARSALAATGR